MEPPPQTMHHHRCIERKPFGGLLRKLWDKHGDVSRKAGGAQTTRALCGLQFWGNREALRALGRIINPRFVFWENNQGAGDGWGVRPQSEDQSEPRWAELRQKWE